MAANYFGILNTFDHLSQDWEPFKHRLQQWYIANDLVISDKSGLKRKAILLTTLSETTYKLTSDLVLPKKLEDEQFQNILDVLDNHFTPKRHGFAERSKFYAASQKAEEGHAQWAARLRGLAAHCSFGNLEESLLDRFVMGMMSGPERDKLFSKDVKELTLAKAVELAESVRCARAAAASVPAVPAAASASSAVFKIVDRNVNEVTKCKVCGFKNHKSKDCRFKNFTCRKCGLKGHLRRMCSEKTSTLVKYVEENSGGEGKTGKVKCISSIRCESESKPMSERILINGLFLQFEIDSGAAVSAISNNTYYKYFSNIPLSPTAKTLKGYGGGRIITLGVMPVPVTYQGVTHTLNVYVVRDGGPPLLGRDFIRLFRLEISPIKYCAMEKDNSLLDNLITDYPTVFSEKIGCFTKYKIRLSLTPDAKPVFRKARPVAYALRSKIDDELNRLLSLGIISEVQYSDHASPIVPVLKKNGEIRICADYSATINKQLIIEKYPLPTVDDLFAKLHGGEQFTKLDLSSAYNQLLLADDDDTQLITCINTHRGLFKYTRLVFGLASAPAIFQKAMQGIVSGLDGVLCLMDDILVTGRNRLEHLERLKTVLARLAEAGLTLRRDKCVFFQNEVNYLGHIIDKYGVRKSPEKIKAIRDARIPTNVTELQSFLGLINYYRNFVPRASTILSPLCQLLNKNSKWLWTDIHQQAFSEIKRHLISNNVLAHFNQNATIILTVDASPYGLGAVLSQVDRDGLERPVSYASRSLIPAEKRYSQIQKEATAIIFGVKRFHQYLYGREHPFILRTDHKPVLSIFGSHKGIPEVTANRLQRYAIFLAAYNFKITYVRSADNIADFLSRSIASTDELSTGLGLREEVNECEDRSAYVYFIVEGDLPVTLDQLRVLTDRDLVLQKVVRYTQHGWPRKVTDSDLKPYYFCKTQLSVEDGCLMKGHKIVIPAELHGKVIKELHSSHLGVVKMKSEARARLWFPGIDAAIESAARSCTVCAQLRPAPPRTPLAPWPFPPHAFYRIHIDFLGPLNDRMYLIVVDAYSKWVECFSMRSTITSDAVIERLYELMSRTGVPAIIVSDNGTSFTSQRFSEFCKLNGIRQLFSAVYHPSSNGQVESSVKIVKKGIKSILLTCQDRKNLDNKINKFLFDYRNSTHSSTNKSPAQLLYGRSLRCRLDLLKPTPLPSSPELSAAVKCKQSLQSKYYGGKKTKDFNIGEEVLIKKYVNKKKHFWIRATIVEKIGRVVYRVFIPELNSHVTRHKNQIRKYNISDQCEHPTSTWDTDSVSDTTEIETVPEITSQSEPDCPTTTAQLTRAGEEETETHSEESSAAVVSEGGATTVTDDGTLSTETRVLGLDIPPTAAQGRAKRNRPHVDYKQFF